MSLINSTAERRALPPGQRPIDWFPRFGKDLSKPPPPVPDHPVIAVRGAVERSTSVDVVALAGMERCELIADFHCVAGWSVTDLRWEGVAFTTFYRDIVEPALSPGAVVSHVQFRGLDGQRSLVEIGDALAGDMLIADTLNGRPLDGDHGAPVRIVSPRQYGYISIKHLCSIEVLTAPPAPRRTPSVVDRLIEVHPRARVWEEERHGSVPSWLIRPLYRVLKWWMLRTAAAARSTVTPRRGE